MADADILTHAYLRVHPVDAARELERQSSPEAAAMLSSVPARLAAPVLAAMLPFVAARCLEHVEPPLAAHMLAQAGVPAAAAILRFFPEARQKVLLDAFPTPVALTVRALLGYAEDAVGAYMDSEIVALPADSHAEHALAAVRGSRVNPAAPVYVIDARHRPLGQVPLSALVRADAAQPLAELMTDIKATLSSLTSVAAAERDKVWNSSDVAPVVERNGALIGVIERRTLHGVQSRHASDAPVLPDALPGLLTMGYWQAVSGLIEAVLFRAQEGPQ
jgi:magnesium transporter